MSAFGNYLLIQLELRQRSDPEYTAGKFAKDLGITPSMLSRFTTGENQSCTPKTLTKICESISDDPVIQAETQVAYLKDQRVKPGIELIQIKLYEPGRVRESQSEIGIDAIVAESNLDFKTTQAMQRIVRGCAKSRRFARMVQDWGHLAENEL